MILSSLIAALLIMADCHPFQAEPASPGQETRNFVIKVDGKDSGSCQMNVAEHPDGTRCFAIHADVRVKQYLFTYKYSFSGTEVWKDGILVRIDCLSNDNGKKTKLTGVLEGSEFRLSVNGAVKITAPVRATTIYGMTPPTVQDQSPVDLLDVDTGKVVRQRLEILGTAEKASSGGAIANQHVRWIGKEKVDVWYDPQGGLRRLTTIDDGHPTEWIRRNP
jgi:hypothetical protein